MIIFSENPLQENGWNGLKNFDKYCTKPAFGWWKITSNVFIMSNVLTKLIFRLWKIISTVSIISTVQKNFKWLYHKHSTKAIFKGLKNHKTRSYNRVFRVLILTQLEKSSVHFEKSTWTHLKFFSFSFPSFWPIPQPHIYWFLY